MMNLQNGVQVDTVDGTNLAFYSGFYFSRTITPSFQTQHCFCPVTLEKLCLLKRLTYHFRINFSVDFAVFIYFELTV